VDFGKVTSAAGIPNVQIGNLTAIDGTDTTVVSNASNSSSTPPVSEGKPASTIMILAIVLPISAALLLGCCVYLCFCGKNKTTKSVGCTAVLSFSAEAEHEHPDATSGRCQPIETSMTPASAFTTMLGFPSGSSNPAGFGDGQPQQFGSQDFGGGGFGQPQQFGTQDFGGGGFGQAPAIGGFGGGGFGQDPAQGGFGQPPAQGGGFGQPQQFGTQDFNGGGRLS
jgi:hypothetical protein